MCLILHQSGSPNSIAASSRVTGTCAAPGFRFAAQLSHSLQTDDHIRRPIRTFCSRLPPIRGILNFSDPGNRIVNAADPPTRLIQP